MLKVESATDALPRLQPSGSSSNQLDKNKDDDKIWTRILSEVSAKANSGLQANVIVLGDHKCGNHSLVTKLEKDKGDAEEASALEYHTVHVQADVRDGSYAYQLGTAGALGPAESLTLPVWLLDGDTRLSSLLSHALPPSSPSKSVVLVTASIDNPSAVASLRTWLNVLNTHIRGKYDEASIREAKQSQERFWQEYVEPIESSMSTSIMQSMEDAISMPLEQGVLSESCGASIIVVLSKSDLANEMPTTEWESVMVRVRRFCLLHGAALFCISSKKGHNIQQLYKYIVHRAFGQPFTSPPQVIERECTFIPAGWDSEKKIDIIGSAANADTLEPTRDKHTIKEQLVEAEDEQSFLARLHSMESAPPAKKSAAPAVDPSAENGALASFFNGLLKPQQGRSPQSAASATPLDAAAQLDRMRAATTPNKAPESSA